VILGIERELTNLRAKGIGGLGREKYFSCRRTMIFSILADILVVLALVRVLVVESEYKRLDRRRNQGLGFGEADAIACDGEQQRKLNRKTFQNSKYPRLP